MSAIQTGFIQGKLAGMKVGSDWPLFYVELYDTSLRIFEGNEDPSRPRRQMRTLEINSTDHVCNKDKDKKRDFKFQYDRFDGKYIFKCQSQEERTTWMNNLQRMIQRKEYIEKGVLPNDVNNYSQAFSEPSPSSSPRIPKVSHTLSYSRHSVDSTMPPPPPPHKRDSGFVSGTADARTFNRGVGTGSTCYSGDSIISHGGKSNSGDSAIVHGPVIVEHVTGCHSDDGKFTHRTNIDHPPTSGLTTANNNKVNVDEEELERYDWYWGEMSREDCTQSLKERGLVGNFVVRKNNRGDFVMTFWRKDAVHHHRILRSGNSFQFEKSVVQATGENIPDLLDTYMKCCTDKTIGPYGGQLYPNYDNPWNPPDIDFEKMSEHLQKVKEKTGGKKLFKAGPNMGDHTYGGLTLDEMNERIKSSGNGEPATPQAVPTPLAGLPSPKPTKPKTSTKPSPTRKPPSKLGVPQPSKAGYVNVLPKPPQQQQQQEEEYSDDDQEVYIQPGDIGEENDESSLYQNTAFNQSNQQQNTNPQAHHDDSNIYQNFIPSPPKPTSPPEPTPPQGLYANVQFNGKPYTPPRQKSKDRRRT